jgi:hypothetical protein
MQRTVAFSGSVVLAIKTIRLRGPVPAVPRSRAMQSVPPLLSKLGAEVVARMAHEVVTGASAVRLQLLASQFYEAVKAELDKTPRHEAAKVGALAAVADQCRRSAFDMQASSPSKEFACLTFARAAADGLLEQVRPSVRKCAGCCRSSPGGSRARAEQEKRARNP